MKRQSIILTWLLALAACFTFSFQAQAGFKVSWHKKKLVNDTHQESPRGVPNYNQMQFVESDDGDCGPVETCASCETDCGVCPTCGNGGCDTGESCASCPEDCGACPDVCPDGICGVTETCASCRSDCGPCPGSCGDGVCQPAESCLSCSKDCGACSGCGDGFCRDGETCASCPEPSTAWTPSATLAMTTIS